MATWRGNRVDIEPNEETRIEETRWIREHIKMRECNLFSRKKDQSNVEDPECQCGHSRSEHNQAKRVSQVDRDKKTNTIQKPTNAFGEIKFVGFREKTGKYIRVKVDTKMPNIVKLLTEKWKMKKPNLLISVAGGADSFQMNKRLKQKIRRGLVKAAQTTGAWIITGGTHSGVMRHVGESIKEVSSGSQNPVVTIGIAPWGCIQNRDQLVNEEGKGLWPANYRLEREQNHGETYLDPNHSHFILCDDGTQHKFAVEIEFRTKLEKELAKLKTDTSYNAVSVPIVMLVLEGGPGTLQTVYHALNSNTQAIIVKGSGRVADILAYAYTCAEEKEPQDKEGNKQKRTLRHMNESLEQKVKAMVEREFGERDVTKHIERIQGCLEKSELMSIYEYNNWEDGSADIDVELLKIALKANQNREMDQIHLALAWNRIDVAKSEIFTDDKRWSTGSLDDVMLLAMQLHRVDFVELFLDHGVSLKDFLTCERLLILYNEISQESLLRRLLEKVKEERNNPKQSLGERLLKKVKGKSNIDRKTERKNYSLLDVGYLIQKLIGKYYEHSYITNEKYADLDADDILDKTADEKHQDGDVFQSIQEPGQRKGNGTGKKTSTWTCNLKHMDDGVFQFSQVPGQNTDKGNRKKTPADQEPDFESPASDLFIWSVLSLQQDMAKLFWSEGKDAIAAALVSNSLLKALANETEDAISRNSIQKDADEWSQLSIGVLRECYSTDECMAKDLLVRELTQWGNLTCMSIAMKADNKEFISQPACQSQLQTIWMGKMMHTDRKWELRRLLLCVFFPLALVFIKLDEDRTSKNTRVNQDEDSKACRSARKRLYYFFTAPVSIFAYNVLSYISFLLLFSYVLIVSFNPKVTVEEIVLIVWVFTLYIEEWRQSHFSSYSLDTWNILDQATILLFIIGMVLRSISSPSTFVAARVFLALAFVTFCMRLLQICYVHKRMGPKLVMIGRMMQDLMDFFIILLVFVISHAVASHSILFPNSPLTWDTAITVIRMSYWNIYGELFLEEIEGEPNCTNNDALWMNNTYPRCPTEVGRYLVPIFMGVYMLLANVLLLNLLIAMFSFTFTKVQGKTDMHWFYQRYSLTDEYYTRPVLAPPLILLSHIYMLYKKCFGSNRGKDNEFCRTFSNVHELVEWEDRIADAFHHNSKSKAFDKMEDKVDTTSTNLDLLIKRLDDYQEAQQDLKKQMDVIIKKLDGVQMHSSC